MNREPQLTNKRHRKLFRDENRSYGTDYGRAYGDDWSAYYSRYDQNNPNSAVGYESHQFYSRREQDQVTGQNQSGTSARPL